MKLSTVDLTKLLYDYSIAETTSGFTKPYLLKMALIAYLNKELSLKEMEKIFGLPGGSFLHSNAKKCNSMDLYLAKIEDDYEHYFCSDYLIFHVFKDKQYTKEDCLKIENAYIKAMLKVEKKEKIKEHLERNKKKYLIATAISSTLAAIGILSLLLVKNKK